MSILKKISKDVLYLIVIVILFFLVLKSCNSSNNHNLEIDRLNQNISVLNDTIRITHNRENELQYERGVLISSKNELESLNKNLYEEVKKQRNKVLFLQNLVVSLGGDTVSNIPTTIVLVDSTLDSLFGVQRNYTLSWDLDTTYSEGNYLRLLAVTHATVSRNSITRSSSDLTNHEIGLNLVTGIIRDGDNYRIFVKSNYPGFATTRIEGAVIPANDPLFSNQTKPKKWSIGPIIMAGFGTSPKQLSVIPIYGVGIGVTYGLIRF